MGLAALIARLYLEATPRWLTVAPLVALVGVVGGLVGYLVLRWRLGRLLAVAAG